MRGPILVLARQNDKITSRHTEQDQMVRNGVWPHTTNREKSTTVASLQQNRGLTSTYSHLDSIAPISSTSQSLDIGQQSDRHDSVLLQVLQPRQLRKTVVQYLNMDLSRSNVSHGRYALWALRHPRPQQSRSTTQPLI